MAKKKPTPKKSQATVKKRIADQKRELLETLEKMPIPAYALKRVGVSKATYHRWRTDSPIFDQQVREAIYRGSEVVNDIAETKLVSSIQEGNLRAVTFWLRHHKREYVERRRIEVEAIKPKRKLTKKEERAVDDLVQMFADAATNAAKTFVVQDDDPDYVN